MLGVLAHLSLCYRLYRLSFGFLLFLFAQLFDSAYFASAQTVINGQTFTNGLAIVDAPAVAGVFHAGSNIPIAIDVSGDGKLPQAAAIPSSSAALWTGFDSLELYLVSVTAGLNITVSNSTSLLTQEPGSTVKHLDFDLPSCVPAGEYNLTVYENSHINNASFFSITPISISVENDSNDSSSAACSSNAVQSFQQSSPPPYNPFVGAGTASPLDTSSLTMPTSYINYPSSFPVPAAAITSGFVTVTVGSSGVILPSPTAPGPVMPSYVTSTLSNGSTATLTITPSSTSSSATSIAPNATITNTVTIVFVSISTGVTTASGVTVTTTVSALSTTTATMRVVGTNSGFLPVNGALQAYGRVSRLLPGLAIVVLFLGLR